MTYFWSLWQFYHNNKFKIYPRHIRKPENVLYFSLIFYLSCMWNQGLWRSEKYSLFTGLYVLYNLDKYIFSCKKKRNIAFRYNIFNARIYSHFKSDTNLMVFLKHRTKFTKSLCNGVNTTAIFYVFQGAFVLYRGYKLHKWKSYLIICLFHQC